MSDAARLTIRPLAGHSEYHACLALQHLVWGDVFTEATPPALLWAAQRTGGFANGAFTSGGELIGFVFGLAGLRDGERFHWLDMLAVHPQQRGRGVAEALMRDLRTVLLARGSALLEWTFEPLESGNAWLYFHRLGATAREYLRDVYGESDSVLHRGLGTDRLVVAWPLNGARVREAQARSVAVAGAPATVLNDVAWEGEWPRSSQPSLAAEGGRLELRIPADIQRLKADSPELARHWREVTRAALEHYLARGWVVADLRRESASLSSYVLEPA